MSIDMQAWKEYYSNELNMMRISNACRYREVIVIKHLETKFKQLIPIKNERKINNLNQSLSNRKRGVYRRYSKEMITQTELLFKQKVPIPLIAKRLDVHKSSCRQWIDDIFPEREKRKIIGTIYVECETCGEFFPRKNSSNKRVNHHFCDSKCSGMWHRKKIPVTCEYCSKSIEITPYKFFNVTHHFCRILCRNRWLAENKRKKHDRYESLEKILL